MSSTVPFCTMTRPPRSALFPYTTLFRSMSTITPTILDDTGPIADDASAAAAPPATVDALDSQLIAELRAGGISLAETMRSEEHTSELQSLRHLVCRLLLEKQNKVHSKTQ